MEDHIAILDVWDEHRHRVSYKGLDMLEEDLYVV